MIFEGLEAEAAAPAAAPSEIVARDLLAACSSEIRRQAGAMASLDASLGAMLDIWRRSSDSAETKTLMTPGLLAELQRADQLRQEMEGIARTLALLVAAGSLILPIRSETVRACTPLGDLQGRLLCGPGRMGGLEGEAVPDLLLGDLAQ